MEWIIQTPAKTLCLDNSYLQELTDPNVHAYYVNLKHLEMDFVDTETGDKVPTYWGNFCFQTPDTYSEATKIRKMKDAFWLAKVSTEAAITSEILPQQEELVKAYFQFMFKQSMNGQFGGGTSLSTGGCPGLTEMVIAVTCA